MTSNDARQQYKSSKDNNHSKYDSDGGMLSAIVFIFVVTAIYYLNYQSLLFREDGNWMFH